MEPTESGEICLSSQGAEKKLPIHVGIVMDGNGRWAKKRGLPRNFGHRKGAEVFENIAKYCRSLGIPYLTVYAFSTENWRRPKDEVDAIMNLLRDYLDRCFKDGSENVKLRFIGDREGLASDLQQKIRDIEEKTRDMTAITVCIALNYGGRDEIVRAARQVARRVASGEMIPEEISEETIAANLYAPDIPDPDLIIRPSGEMRSSNFLLWQSAYAEYVFMNVLWPDFTPKHLDEALKIYSGRNRRFGGI